MHWHGLKYWHISSDNNNFKWEEISHKYVFFLNTHWTQLLTPLEIIMSKIYVKYIPIHIHN